MGRLPPIERCPLTGCLKYSSAMLWYYFLSEEADFEGDTVLCKDYLQKAEQLSLGPQGYICSAELEKAIKKYVRGKNNEQDERLGSGTGARQD